MEVLWLTNILPVLFVVLSTSKLAYAATCSTMGIERHTETETYLQQYTKSVPIKTFWPWGQRTRVVTGAYPVTRVAHRSRWVRKCCAGYRGIHPNCFPICSFDCTNGICEAPNVCTCKSGYRKVFNSHVCEPICSQGCRNGICSAPEKCTCNEGYKIDEQNNCAPICESGCPFGNCISPNKCECLPGYALNQLGTACEPICAGGCKNGICSAPDICSCYEGYMIMEQNNCVPICDNGCPFGKCIAPNKCECEPDYILNFQSNTCEPICLGGCLNGICSAPNKCTCNEGYELFGDKLCNPICESNCPNGKCIEPNKCECDSGYKLNQLGTVCEPICIDDCKNGLCTAPGKCICIDHFKLDESNKCVPICDSDCLFGKCIAPNKCECQPGYTPTPSEGSCEPKCSNGCDHGFCYRPEMCVCHQGYLMGPENRCEPVCSHGCDNGKCVEPEICHCLPGYQMGMNSVNKCEPICEPECENADCVEPDVCICWNNYFPINRTTCDPYCPKECLNGYCAEPFNCSCNMGYEAHDYEPNVCVPICDNCDYGDCLSPGNCLCWPGYEKDHEGLCNSETTLSNTVLITDSTTFNTIADATTDTNDFDSISENLSLKAWLISSTITTITDPVQTTRENSVSTIGPNSISSFSHQSSPRVYLENEFEQISSSTERFSLLCNCWFLSFATANSSQPGACTPHCNSTVNVQCINIDACDINKNQIELICNGSIYICKAVLGQTSTAVAPRTNSYILWILIGGFVVMSAIGLLFVMKHYRHRGSHLIDDNVDSKFEVQYVN